MDRIKLETQFGEANKEYKKFRPTYPEQLFKIIFENVQMPYKKAVDIGAGTGISTRILSETFENVIAIEPDEKMISMGSFGENTHVINDCAENVEIDSNTVDLITAGNAFYWMEADTILKKMYVWLKKEGIIAAYRYNLPLTDNSLINQEICIQSELNWDYFRHDRLRDTEYTYRNIKKSLFFCDVKVERIENIVALKPEDLVGFFASTSYGSAYLRSLDNPDVYLVDFLNQIKKLNGSSTINVDFSLELVMAKKK